MAAHLKIGARQLRLEEGDIAGLPHPAYAKGFIRSYAAYVGLAAEEVATALVTLNSDAEAARPRAFMSWSACPRLRVTSGLFWPWRRRWCCWLVWAGWPGGRERWIL